MTETPEMRRILLDSAKAGATLFRNNVAQAWVGEFISNRGGTVTLRNARPLHAGLCVGSSDLIGATPIVVTSELVGHCVAIFTAIEVKFGKGRTTTEQQKFIDEMNRLGAIAGVAFNSAEAVTLLNKYGAPARGTH